MSNLLNGMKVLGRRNNTLYVRIPVWLQQPIDGCSCTYCKTHPKEPPMWDTLAIATGTENVRRNDHTWTVHMPDANDAI